MTPVELAGTEPPAPRRRRALTAALTVALLSAGGLAAVTGRPGGRTPEEAMAALRSFLSEATSVHFDGTAESDAVEDFLPVRFEADVILPEQGHWISSDRYSTSEGVAVGSGAYYRAAASPAMLHLVQWRWRDDPDEPDAVESPKIESPKIESLLSFVSGVPLGLGGLDFAALRHLADGVESPEAVGAGVYRGRVSVPEAPPGLLFGSGRTGTVDFTVADGGRLARAVWRLSGDAVSDVIVDIRFSKWGEPLPLTVPDLDEVDPTPEIDEEAVAAFDAAPLLAPKTLPEAWILLGAYPDEYRDRDGTIFHDGWESPCPALTLWYQPAFDPLGSDDADVDADQRYLRFLKLTESAASCPAPEVAGPQPSLPDGGEAGRHKTITATMGATRVQASSHFSEADLRGILNDLVPLDLHAQPTQRSVPPAG